MTQTALPVSSDHEAKLARLLQVAAEIFAEKGYHNTSIRDIARTADVSLSGLYYYFRSKEELLFMIQDRCFRTVMQGLKERLDGLDSPELRLRALVYNHVHFFAQNMAAMRITAHEFDSLQGQYEDRIQYLRRQYSEMCTEILRDLRRLRGAGEVAPLSVSTYALFGMINWIYTWYRADGDVSVDRLAEHLYQLFLSGFMGYSERPRRGRWTAPDRRETRTNLRAT